MLAEAARETLDERSVAEIVDCVCKHPRHRELLYKTLSHCTEERTLADVEEWIERQPEYASALQDASALVKSLSEHRGVLVVTRDEEGNPLSEEDLLTMTQQGERERVAAALSGRTIATTPQGKAAVSLLSPERRIDAFARKIPGRRNAFVELLEFCKTPRTLGEVNALFENSPYLDPTEQSGRQRLRPAYFLDRMEEAGGLVWDKAWVTTEAGKLFLASEGLGSEPASERQNDERGKRREHGKDLDTPQLR